MDLKAQVGPLKVWQWGGVVVLAAAGFLWWRSRQAGSAASGNLDSSAADTSGNTPDYSTGYDAGYGAGLNATGDGGTAGDSSGSGGTSTGSGGSGGTGTGGGSGTGTGGTNPPKSHNRFCTKVKDPAGRDVEVCAYGTWKKVNGRWTWVSGVAPPPGGHLTHSALNSGSGSTLQWFHPGGAQVMEPLPVGQHTSYAAA